MTRILAVDWGTRRIGLALSDALNLTAQPLPPILLPAGQDPAHVPVFLARALLQLAEEHEVARYVLGLPLELSGERGPAAQAVDALADALRARTKLPVEFIQKMISDPEFSYAPEPENVMKIYSFMNKVGALKNMPATWQDLFFPEVHALKGN